MVNKLMHVRQSPAVCPVPLFHIYIPPFHPHQLSILTCLHSARGAAGPLRCFDAAHLWQLGWGSSALDLPVDAVPLGERWTCLATIPWTSDSITHPIGHPSRVRRYNAQGTEQGIVPHLDLHSLPYRDHAPPPSRPSPLGSWQYQTNQPLGTSPDGFIRLLPISGGGDAGGGGDIIYISYRVAAGCDADTDPQFLDKVLVRHATAPV